MHLIESRAPKIESSVTFRFDRKSSSRDLVKIVFGKYADDVKDTSLATFMPGLKDDYALSSTLTLYMKISNKSMLAFTPTPAITNSCKFEVSPKTTSRAWIRTYLKAYDATIYSHFKFIMVSLDISNHKVVVHDKDAETISSLMGELRRFNESFKTST